MRHLVAQEFATRGRCTAFLISYSSIRQQWMKFNQLSWSGINFYRTSFLSFHISFPSRVRATLAPKPTSCCLGSNAKLPWERMGLFVFSYSHLTHSSHRLPSWLTWHTFFYSFSHRKSTIFVTRIRTRDSCHEDGIGWSGSKAVPKTRSYTVTQTLYGDRPLRITFGLLPSSLPACHYDSTTGVIPKVLSPSSVRVETRIDHNPEKILI